MAKLVLFGATGYGGGNILGEAIRRGHHVTAVARHTERSVKLNDTSIHAVAGSLYDRALLSALSADADVLICAITGVTQRGRLRPTRRAAHLGRRRTPERRTHCRGGRSWQPPTH